jgi:hypothetical protein
MAKRVLHKGRQFQRWGGTVYTTLCGRMAVGNDGMNIANSDAEVSCKFCLRRMKSRGN